MLVYQVMPNRVVGSKYTDNALPISKRKWRILYARGHRFSAHAAEFPESLVSDSKVRVPRLQTRLGLGLGLDVPGSPSLRLGLGLKVKLSLVSDLELGLISTGFICKMGVSGSKYRGSRLKTRNRTRNRSRCSNQARIGLGIGLEIQTWPVSDSKSSLENGDSGNSDSTLGFLFFLP